MKRYRAGQFTLPSKSVVTPLFVVLPHTIAGEIKNAHNIGLRCAVHFSLIGKSHKTTDLFLSGTLLGRLLLQVVHKQSIEVNGC